MRLGHPVSDSDLIYGSMVSLDGSGAASGRHHRFVRAIQWLLQSEFDPTGRCSFPCMQLPVSLWGNLRCLSDCVCLPWTGTGILFYGKTGTRLHSRVSGSRDLLQKMAAFGPLDDYRFLYVEIFEKNSGNPKPRGV